MASQSNDPVILRIMGVDWAFWTDVEITRQMDAIAGSFSISLVDRWAESGSASGQSKAFSGKINEMLPIMAGQECELLIGGDPVINGYIYESSPFLTAGSHGIDISGRDRSGDLVDASALNSPGQWLNQNALMICRELAAPFGIEVRAEGDLGAAFPSFQLEQGETAFEAMDRILQQRELLAMPDGKGGLVLLKVGDRRNEAGLKLGRNILSASLEIDMNDRFSNYLVLAQQQGSDEVFGEAAAAVSATARDSAVKRYRPLVVRAETVLDSAGAEQRAAWEKSVRAARSVSLNVTVQGFRQLGPQGGSAASVVSLAGAAVSGSGDNPLWQVNALTNVDIPYLRLNQTMITTSVTFQRSAQSGSTTTLVLKDPAAFAPAPHSENSLAGAAAATGLDGKDIAEAFAEQAEQAHSAIKF